MSKQKEKIKKKISMKKILKILTGAGVIITGANEFHDMYIKNKKLQKQNKELRKKVNRNDDDIIRIIVEENEKLKQENEGLHKELKNRESFFNTGTKTTQLEKEITQLEKEITQLEKENKILSQENSYKDKQIIVLRQENFNLKKQNTQKILESNINKLNSENKKLNNKIKNLINVLERWKNDTYSQSYREEYQDVIDKLNTFGRILRRL